MKQPFVLAFCSPLPLLRMWEKNPVHPSNTVETLSILETNHTNWKWRMVEVDLYVNFKKVVSLATHHPHTIQVSTFPFHTSAFGYLLGHAKALGSNLKTATFFRRKVGFLSQFSPCYHQTAGSFVIILHQTKQTWSMAITALITHCSGSHSQSTKAVHGLTSWWHSVKCLWEHYSTVPFLSPTDGRLAGSSSSPAAKTFPASDYTVFAWK